ncbi:MAG: hypothetical protein AMXMBFR64_15920 [Myxococcales bacterium]
MRPMWVVAMVGVLTGCASAPPPPPPVPVAPPPAPVVSWLDTLAAGAGIEVPVATDRIPLGAAGEPGGAPVVLVTPAGIFFDGAVVVRAALVEDRIEAPAAQGKRIGTSALIAQLFDAAKARNPRFQFNAPGGTTGPREPVVMIADSRAPVSLLARARNSVWHAGWQPTGWVVRDAAGAPRTLAVEDPPVCRRAAPPKVTEIQGGSRTGTPSGIAIAASAVVGACDAASQDQVIRELAELLGTCWGRTVAQVALLEGETDDATLTWVTAPDGSVEGVFAESSFLGYGADMGACILSVVKSKRHAPPSAGRCLGTTRVTYQAGEMVDRLTVEPRVGAPETLPTPLRHAECRLSAGRLGFALFPMAAGGCGAGGSIWAQIDRAGVDRLPDWLAEVAGAGGADLQTVNLRTDEKATLGDTLRALDALGRAGAKPALRMGVD